MICIMFKKILRVVIIIGLFCFVKENASAKEFTCPTEKEIQNAEKIYSVQRPSRPTEALKAHFAINGVTFEGDWAEVEQIIKFEKKLMDEGEAVCYYEVKIPGHPSEEDVLKMVRGFRVVTPTKD